MTFVARSRTTDNRFYGVEEGIVTSVEDDKTKEGRVKVKLVRHEIELECRLCNPYAGNGYGFFFGPEAGDEVLIAFIQGDMRFPVILGGLYNGKDKPPTFRAKDKNQKMIKTKAGHQIMLDDTGGSEKIVIVDKSGDNSILIDTVGKAVTITCKNGKLTLSGKEVHIESKAGMTIEAPEGTLDVTGSTINLN